MIGTDIDPIDLEVLRSRLEAVGEQACRTIEQTAVSPAITESKDFSVTLLDADGGLIIGAGPGSITMGLRLTRCDRRSHAMAKRSTRAMCSCPTIRTTAAG